MTPTESTLAGTNQMAAQMATKPGFIAALDQSGGSTPAALRQYGIADDSYHGDAEMMAAIHAMRVRIMTAPAFSGEKIIGAILFEATMDGLVEGKPTPAYLWQDRGIVPFLKIDKGLADEAGSVRLMKPIPGLDTLLARAAALGIYGTKMRSVINAASPDGIAAVADQQFALGRQISAHGLMPILEPEVSINAPDKAAAETLLRDALHTRLDALPGTETIMLKLTIPTMPDLYTPLAAHPRVQRVVALSGGYSRQEACAKLRLSHGMIASFSRALIDGLRAQMNDAAFDAELAKAIDEIYDASIHKA
jgi:fructose-bisphosphate aldolase class I